MPIVASCCRSFFNEAIEREFAAVEKIDETTAVQRVEQMLNAA